MSITPDFLTRSLDAGAAVDLQASQSVTISSPITVSAGGQGGALTIDDATLLLDANISTDGGALTLSGTVSPAGDSTGIVQLAASTTSFKPGSTYSIQLQGPTPGTQFDQLQVRGDIDLGNATLKVSSAGGIASGQNFAVVQSSQPITTTFAGLPEGSILTVAGQQLIISYLNDSVTLTTRPSFTFSPSTLANVSVGTSYSQQLAVTGGTAPYTFAVTSGSLPAGLSLSTAGLLEGTATVAGSFTFTVTATDSSPSPGPFGGPQTYTLVVKPITLSPGTLPDAQVGVSYQQALTASGGTGPDTFTVTSGMLPAGLSLSPAGVLSGQPTTAGTFTFTLQASDSSPSPGPFTGAQTYTLVVNPLTLSPTTLPDGHTGASYQQTLTVSGGTGPYTFTLTAGALPAGLALSSAGVLSGQPTAAGSFTFTVQASDSSPSPGPFTGSQAYSLLVHTITLSPAVLPTAPIGATYSQPLTASGETAPYTFTLTSGTLPPGLSLSSKGLLSGTPTVTGSFSFIVTASDSSPSPGPFTASQSYTLLVYTPLPLTPATLPNAQVGARYQPALSASGGTPPYTFQLSAGALPPGLSLSTAGALRGAPRAAGSFTFTVTATDSSANPGPLTGSQTYTLLVTTTRLRTTSLADAQAGTRYHQLLTATGGTAPYTFKLSSGSLPAGLSMSSTGVLSGTPTKSGTFHFTVRATDHNGIAATRRYTLTVQLGAPARVTFLTQPSSTYVDVFLAPFAVRVLDRFGNAVRSPVTLTLVIVKPGLHAGFGPGSVTQVTPLNGVATFRTVSISAKGTYRLVAHDGLVTAESNPFTVG